MQTLAVWLLSALTLYVTSLIVPGFELANFGSALLAALVLGLLNALLRPVLLALSFPITLLTLGLFTFVINAVILGVAAFMLDGFRIYGLVPAIVGAVILACLNALVHLFFDRRKSYR